MLSYFAKRIKTAHTRVKYYRNILLLSWWARMRCVCVCVCVCVSVFVLGPHLQHMEVPRPGVESIQNGVTYATAIAQLDP